MPATVVTTDVRATDIASRPRRRSPSLAAWLLVVWIGLCAGWFVSRLRLPVCPYGQTCDRSALAGGWNELGWPVLVAVGGMLFFGALWWWQRSAEPVRRVDVQPRPLRTVRATALAAIAVVVAGNLLLIAPKPDRPFCAETVRLNQAMAYQFHCDSPGFLELAHHPANLLNRGELRQSRPGYVVVAAAATAVVGGVTDRLGLGDLLRQRDSAYVPLVLINMALLFAAIVLFARVSLLIGLAPWATVALCAVILINDLTKSFLWTPHQQLLALLVPVGTILLGWWVVTREPRRDRMIVAGLAVGLVALIYASVLITLAAIVVLVLVRHRRAGFERAGMFLLAGILPNLAWIITCRVVAGDYYNQEVRRFGEFVWLIVGYRDGSLSERLVTASVKTLREVYSVAVPAIALVLILAVLSVVLRVDVRPRTRADRAILAAAALCVALAVALNWGIGFIAPRIMFHVVPPLLIVAGWLASRLMASGRTGRMAVAVVLGSIAAIAVALPFAGPSYYS